MTKIDLHYDVHGHGHPLVLIQGGQLDLRMWDQQVEPLARSHRVIRYDVRGLGRSSQPGVPFQHHEDLYELLGHLSVDRAHFVGLSLGGRIALDLCLEHPEVVSCLVLSGPGVSGFSWSRDASFAPIAEAARAGDATRAADLWLEHPYMVPTMEIPQLSDRVRTLARENSQVWVQPFNETGLEPPAIERLNEIRVPTLLLVGTRDVPDIQTIAGRLTSQITDLKRVDFEGAGHILNMEQPERFTQEVIDFLTERCNSPRAATQPPTLT